MIERSRRAEVGRGSDVCQFCTLGTCADQKGETRLCFTWEDPAATLACNRETKLGFAQGWRSSHFGPMSNAVRPA